LAEGAILGGFPQHIHMPEKLGALVVGSDNVFREHVTVHRSLYAEQATTIGDGNLLMVGSHVAHDCRVGHRVIFANNVMLAGHVSIDDGAFLSGAVGVHQFCRVGSLAMVGGQAHVIKDIPPFMTVDGVSTCIVGVNRIGLRRAGFAPSDAVQLKAAYRLVYRSGLAWSEVLQRLADEFSAGPAAKLLEFFRGGTRGFTPARVAPPGSTLRLRTDQPADDEQREMPATKAG
jgi:UDP-N-acetylglucosamine acyltransferase